MLLKICMTTKYNNIWNSFCLRSESQLGQKQHFHFMMVSWLAFSLLQSTCNLHKTIYKDKTLLLKG